MGERIEERESDRTEEVLARQCANGIAGLSVAQFEKIVVAYEERDGRVRAEREARAR